MRLQSTLTSTCIILPQTNVRSISQLETNNYTLREYIFLLRNWPLFYTIIYKPEIILSNISLGINAVVLQQEVGSYDQQLTGKTNNVGIFQLLM